MRNLVQKIWYLYNVYEYLLLMAPYVCDQVIDDAQKSKKFYICANKIDLMASFALLVLL